MKRALQCDFDGTITIGEVSRFLLEEFADGDWLSLEKEYKAGSISVQDCNIGQFAMVKIDRDVVTDFLLNGGKVIVRPGFRELLDYCLKQGMDFIITSNGLRFYIETILSNLGIDNIEVLAAEAEFSPNGMKLTYIGPDGNHIGDGFKEAWMIALKDRNYDALYYVGNGVSDIYPARHADHVFAIDGLLEQCRANNISYTPFSKLSDVIKGLKDINA